MSEGPRRAGVASTLHTLGFLDEDQLDALQAVDAGATWSDALQSIGLLGDELERALEVVEHPLSHHQVTPETSGRYAPLRDLGEGGMGRVHLVEDAHLHRRVARKELLVHHPAIELRFLREARITGQLEHPGIIPIYELGRDNEGQLYYTMKEIRGQTLREAIDGCDSRLGRLKLLTAFVDTCLAVGYAHSNGVIHRDLKPENVMVGAFGETLVLDWGLARVAGEEELPADGGLTIRSGDHSDLTRAGTVMGTPRYMSPEQAAGKLDQVDAPADVWSLGVILHEIITGNTPFEGPVSLVLDQVKDGIVPPPLEVDPDAPPDLVAVAMKAMARLPEDRYQTAVELAEEVERWRLGQPVLAHDYTPVELLRRAAAANRSVIIGAAVVVLAVLASAAFFVPRVMHQRDLAEREAEAANLRAQRLEAWGMEMAGDPSGALAVLRDAMRSHGLTPLEQRETRAHIERLVRGGADVRVLATGLTADTPIAWSSRGTRLASIDGNRVVVADPQSGSTLGTVETEAAVSAFTFGTDNRTVFVGTHTGVIRQVAFLDLGVKSEWTGSLAPIRLLPDPGGVVAVADTDGGARLTRWDHGQESSRYDLLLPGVRQAAATVSAEQRLWAAADRDLNRVDLARGEGLSPVSHDGQVLAVTQVRCDPLCFTQDSTIARRAEALLDPEDAGEFALPPASDPALHSLRAGAIELQDSRLTGDVEADVRFLRSGISARLSGLTEQFKSLARRRSDLVPEAAYWLGEAALVQPRIGLSLRASEDGMDDADVALYERLLRSLLIPKLLEARVNGLGILLDALERAEKRGIDAPWVAAARRRLRLEAPDQMLITAGADDRVYVWVPGGGLRSRFRAHQGDVTAVAADPEGRLATGGRDGRVRVWDLLTGRPILDLPLAGQVDKLAFAGPNRLVTHLRGSDTLQIWETSLARSENLASGASAEAAPLQVLHSGVGPVQRWELSPGRDEVAVLAGGELRLFRVREAPTTRVAPPMEDGEPELVLGGGLVWWGTTAMDLATLERTDPGSASRPDEAAGSKDGEASAPGAELPDGTVLIGEAEALVAYAPDGTRKGVWHRAAHPITAVTVSPEGPHAAVVTSSTVTLVSTATQRAIAEVPWTTAERRGQLGWLDHALVIAEEGAPGVRLIDPATGASLGDVQTSSLIAEFVASGDRLVLLSEDGFLHSTSISPVGEPETNLRACADGRVVAELPFPRREDLSAPDGCRANRPEQAR